LSIPELLDVMDALADVDAEKLDDADPALTSLFAFTVSTFRSERICGI